MKKKVSLSILIFIFILFVMQFYDSYCADLYNKLQSFLLSEFLIEGKGMSQTDAVSYMGYATLPFYILPMLAPLVRMLVDKIGMKPLFCLNIFLLMFGCLVCSHAQTVGSYLIGNSIVIFSTSMDIQYLYIAQDIPYTYRATIRGWMAGIAAFATMLIPILRSGWIVMEQKNWRSLYLFAVWMGVAVFFVSLFLKRNHKTTSVKMNVRQTHTSQEQPKQTKVSVKMIARQTEEKRNVALETKPIAASGINNQKTIRRIYICLFLIGIATSGITFYNEPLVSFQDADSKTIVTILFLQPIVTVIINILIGYLADKFGRAKLFIASVLAAMLSLLVFVCFAWFGCIHEYLGIFWGLMVGCYFSSVNLLNLTVLELAEKNKIGKVSAYSTYANGIGNAIGILLCTCLVKKTGMAAIKLITCIPVMILAILHLPHIEDSPIEDESVG